MQPASENSEAASDMALMAMPTVSLSEIKSAEADTLGQPVAIAQPVQPAPFLPPFSVQPPAQPQIIQPRPVQPIAQLPIQPPIQPPNISARPAEAAISVEQPVAQLPAADELSPHSPDHSSVEVDPAQGTVMLLGEDFPDLADAESGCYGLAGCRQLSGNYRQAAEQLLAQLKAQGYQLTERDDIDSAGHRVFEAIAPDQPDDIYFLNVFSPAAGSTVYVMAAEILSLEQLQQLGR